MIGSFRRPLTVAASLARRNGFDTATSLRLWTEYNERLLAYHEKYGVGRIDFDLPAARYGERVRAVLGRLGLSAPSGGFTFFEDELRTATPAEGCRLPERTGEIYARLREAAL